MRTFSRDIKSTYYKYQSPAARNFTQEKRLKELHTLKDNEVKVGIYKYSTDDDLGKGFSSKVYKGVEIQKIHKRYAIKVIQLKKFRGSSLQMLQAEIEIHKNLIHQNVVRLYQVVKTPYFYYIIMEYCPHGNLHQYIRQKKKLTEKNALDIMTQVLAGSKYLMQEGIIHRDIKPANILRIGNKWKISDFGFAVKSKFGFKDRINVGTPLYMSPQSLKKSYYSAKTDIFAYGVTLFQMVEGRTPWESRNQKQLLEKIKEPLQLPSTIKHEKIRQFIERACELSQNKRMNRQELMEFQLLPSQAHPQGTAEKESVLASEKSRAINSERVSMIAEKKGSNQLNFGYQLEFLLRQFLFAKHLYSCIRHFDSFLVDEGAKERLVLVFFKLLLKVIRFLSEKKDNIFHLQNWPELTSSKPYREQYQKIIDHAQIYEKEYLQQIKLNDIKNIRKVNKTFPDLCHRGPLPPRFYYSLQDFLVTYLRLHNHEVMLLLNKKQENTENHQKQLSSMQQIASPNRPLLTEETDAPVNSQSKAQSRKRSAEYFPSQSEIPISQLLSEGKKQSRLQIKRVSRRQSRDQISTSKMSKEEDKQKQIQPSTLKDKYQALQSLFTIYRVAEMRGSYEEQKSIEIERIDVCDNYFESKLQKRDYIDLRRLLRRI